MITKNEKYSIIHLLWSGGWDSTFRLLDLVLRQKKIVQPYYIISPRKSLNEEIRAIKQIVQCVYEKYPESKNYLQQVIFKDRERIPPNSPITKSHTELRRHDPSLGFQWEWFARFARDQRIKSIEIGIVKDDLKEDDIILKGAALVEEYTDRKTEPDSEIKRSPEYELFHYFSFPLLHMKKRDMELIAKKYGFNDILELAWFCFLPSRNGQPCGFCPPCRMVLKAGLKRRIPLLTRYRLVFIRLTFIREAREYIVKYPLICAFLRGCKRMLGLKNKKILQ